MFLEGVIFRVIKSGDSEVKSYTPFCQSMVYLYRQGQIFYYMKSETTFFLCIEKLWPSY